MTATKIRPRERDAIIHSLRSGVVPRTGQHHIQVGRAEEVRAVVCDLDRIADGGSGTRFLIGEYGSGKTFFLNLLRTIAMEKRFVTIHADLSPDRRLHATRGQARSLYAELMRNMATRGKPDGGALATVVERFVTQALTDARTHNVAPEHVIRQRLSELSEMVGGYDFAEIVAAYWTGHDTGNEQLKTDAVRWLRGEYATKTDARASLGVRTIIDDANFYDQLKLFARFTTMAGFAGLFVCLDEMVNLYKLANTQARNANYEQILRIVNDSLQGNAAHLGFLLGGTPDFLLDTRRGLYSYQALQSRLAENTYATGGLVDYSGPVLRLDGLTPEDFYVLLTRLRHVYASGDSAAYLLPDDALYQFMQHCNNVIGDTYFRTPRTTVKEFLNLLAVLEQNPGSDWRSLIGTIAIAPEGNPDLAPLNDETDPAAASVHEAMTGAPVCAAHNTAAPGPVAGTADDELTTLRL
ncbi:MAG: hypothetical protein QG597_3192 [Actinomycetota bacterium]|nr:hypothetical protein [Actinomycetota bacterium]